MFATNLNRSDPFALPVLLRSHAEKRALYRSHSQAVLTRVPVRHPSIDSIEPLANLPGEAARVPWYGTGSGFLSIMLVLIATSSLATNNNNNNKDSADVAQKFFLFVLIAGRKRK